MGGAGIDSYVGSALSRPRPQPDPWVLLSATRTNMRALGMETEDPWLTGHLDRREAEVLADAELDRLRRFRQLLREQTPLITRYRKD